MHALEELKDMLMEELEKCSKKGELSAGSLEVIDKLAHAVKSIDTIMAMEGYSEDSGEYMDRGGNYGARGRGRNAQRDSRGRYADGYGGYREGRMYRRYRDDAREDLVEQLKEMEMEAKDEESRRMVQKWIRQAEQA